MCKGKKSFKATAVWNVDENHALVKTMLSYDLDAPSAETPPISQPVNSGQNTIPPVNNMKYAGKGVVIATKLTSMILNNKNRNKLVEIIPQPDLAEIVEKDFLNKKRIEDYIINNFIRIVDSNDMLHCS